MWAETVKGTGLLMATCPSRSETPSFENIFEFDLSGDQHLNAGHAASAPRHTAEHDAAICGPEFTTMITRPRCTSQLG